MLIVH